MAFPIGAVVGALGGLASAAVQSGEQRRATERIKRQQLAAELMRKAQTQALFNRFRQAATERRGVNSAALLRGAQEQAAQGSAQIAASTAAAGAQEQSQRNQLLLNQGNRQTAFLRGAMGGALDAIGTGLAQGATSGTGSAAPAAQVGSSQGAQQAAPPAGQAFGGGTWTDVTPVQDQFTSDKRLKSQIKQSTGMDTDEFIEALSANRFVMDGQRRTGVMAQDLQQTDIGSEMVSERGDGTLQVDGQRALEATMGATGRLGERLSALEQQRGSPVFEAPNMPMETLPSGERIPAAIPGATMPNVRPDGSVVPPSFPSDLATRTRQAQSPQVAPEPRHRLEIGEAQIEPERRLEIGPATIHPPPQALGRAQPRAGSFPGAAGASDDAVTFNEGAFDREQAQFRQNQTSQEEERRRRDALLEQMLLRGLLPGGRTL